MIKEQDLMSCSFLILHKIAVSFCAYIQITPKAYVANKGAGLSLHFYIIQKLIMSK